MSELLAFCPAPPSWQVCWEELDREYSWVRALAGCPQDPVHHAEGDVWIHTRMVCEALAALPAWRLLPEDERQVVFAAALLHDVAKPACTRTDDSGRISTRGHSRHGSIQARVLLWRMGVSFALREQVAGLIRHHQAPYFLIDRPDARRLCLEISQTARCDHLALLAEADVRGRIAADQQRLLDNVELFRTFCQEQDCWSGPYVFPSDHTRFLYFQQTGRPPDVLAHDDCRCEVRVMSGLPGSGEDHYIRTELADWPVISLDELRAELDVEPTDTQGTVLQEARRRARDYLRQGQRFVWNATNLSRQIRGEVIRLLAAYRARVHIIHVETSADRLLPQNRQRPAPVPEAVIEGMLQRWELPDLTEAHQVSYQVNG
jgi:predicted kinase